MKKILLFFSILFFSTFCFAQGVYADFPFQVRIDTIVGDCYNNSGVNIVLLDSIGNEIVIDEETHAPQDTAYAHIYDVQYYYQNSTWTNPLFSNSSAIVLEPGVYNVGVRAHCRVETSSGSVYTSIDTLISSVSITSTYSVLDASVLGALARNSMECGNRMTIPCFNVGRIQLRITDGKFPYVVYVVDLLTQDTVRVFQFDENQYSGNQINRYDYRDYYTLDSLAKGNYKLIIQDGCSYSVVRYYNVVEREFSFPNVSIYHWDARIVCEDSLMLLPFGIRCNELLDYEMPYYNSLFQYRFINPAQNGTFDTTAWSSVMLSSSSRMVHDTLYPFNSVMGQNVIMQVRNTCLNTISASSFYIYISSLYATTWQTNANTVANGMDTCGVRALIDFHICGQYDIYRVVCGQGPYVWVYTDTATHTVIYRDTVQDELATSTITSEYIQNFYGEHTVSIPLNRVLYDGEGHALLSHFSVITVDTVLSQSSWEVYVESNDPCCSGGPRRITLFEKNSPFPLYRDTVVVRLARSPAYNRYNFTAIYTSDTCAIVRDNPQANDMEIVADTSALRLVMSSDCMIGGEFVFYVTTSCKTDTCRVVFSNPYYDYEVVENPRYRTEQLCGKLLVMPTNGRVVRRQCMMNVSISNDELQVSSTDNSVSFHIEQGVAGGYNNYTYHIGDTMELTIPGVYVMRMHSAAQCGNIDVFDTIVFERQNLDYKKTIAVVCDSMSTTGNVWAMAMNGSQPYTYTVYSQADKSGTVLGENHDGFFADVPISIGQTISIQVEDSCENSYYVNLIVTKLNSTSLVWFDDFGNYDGVCEGDTIHVSAALIDYDVQYHWTGPDGFTCSNRFFDYYVPRGAESGFFTLQIQNTGCNYDVYDSVFLNVLTSPQILLSQMDSVCPGTVVLLNCIAEGMGVVNFEITRFCESQYYTQRLSCQSGDTLEVPYTIFSDNLFWVEWQKDARCVWRTVEDSVRVSIFTTHGGDSIEIVSLNRHICQGEDVELLVQPSLNHPYTVYWFDSEYQDQMIDSIRVLSDSTTVSYSISNLMTDTTLYVVVGLDDACPAFIGGVSRVLEMTNGMMTLNTGDGVRLYDSGGPSRNYQNSEHYQYTFDCGNAPLVLVMLDYFSVAVGDTLYIYDGDSQNAGLVAVLTGNVSSSVFRIHSGMVTFVFSSNLLTTAKGWSLRVVTSAMMQSVSAWVHEPTFDTLAVSTCQSDSLFAYNGFGNIDVSEVGNVVIDSLFYSVVGCDSNVRLMLTVLPTATTYIDTSICDGESVYISSVPYEIEGSYQESFTAQNGCDSIVKLNLNVVRTEMKVVTIGDDFCDFYKAVLSVEGNTWDYHWSTGENQEEIVVTQPGLYSVTAYGNGCEKTVNFVIPECTFDFDVPNAITPSNHDGVNDFFALPEHVCALIRDFEISVYNRWGEQVFMSYDKNFRWDGSVAGKIQTNVVYNYVVSCKDNSGRTYLFKGGLVVL